MAILKLTVKIQNIKKLHLIIIIQLKFLAMISFSDCNSTKFLIKNKLEIYRGLR